jgi:hypothetical protein
MAIIKIHNIETGEIVEREMDADELAQNQRDLAQTKAEDEAQAAKAANKAALLARMGLTEDEARLLLS